MSDWAGSDHERADKTAAEAVAVELNLHARRLNRWISDQRAAEVRLFLEGSASA